MFMEIIKSIFSLLWMVIKWPLIIIGCIILLFVLSCLFFFVREFLKGRRLNFGSIRRVEKRPALLRIFVDAPKMFIEDLYNTPPDFFQEQGCIIFTGRQGRGKTVSIFQKVMELQYKYPKCKVISNTPYKFQDEALNHWKQLINYKNGQQGVVVVMDELQNWFSSNQSRNFPPEMLSVITQNRKNRRLILGTAQSFHLLAKAIRSQATEVRSCVTLAKVLTIVVRREPELNSEGDVIKMKYRGMYFFVHTKELRESYNTWATVENLSKSGFHDNPFLKDAERIIEKTKEK